jgi:hypothetical protein
VSRVGNDFNWWPSDYDGTLGLGPFDVDKAVTDPKNFLKALLASKEFVRNLFALLLPT